MNIIGWDCSHTGDGSVFTICETGNGESSFYQITRKQYFIMLIKEQPYFK